MNPHANEHELLLAALLSGERSAEEPEVAAQLGACATCRERHARLGRTAAALSRAAGERRAVLAEPRGPEPAPGEESVLPTLARLFAADARARPRTQGRWLWAAAAVLVLAAGAWIVARARATPAVPEAPTTLGEHGLVLLEPRSGVAEYGAFSWKYEDGTPDSFTLRIYAADDEARRHPLVERERLRETSWTPDPPLLETLPDRILWQVDAFDEFHALLPSGSSSASAWRSR